MSTKIKEQIRLSRIESFSDNYEEEWKELGIEIFQINTYQYRFVLRGKEIDYFPTSGKYHDISANKWGTCPAHSINKLFGK